MNLGKFKIILDSILKFLLLIGGRPMRYINLKKYQVKNITDIKSLKHQEKSQWNFLPQKKWYLKFEDHWEPGEDAALSKLKKYINEDIDHYKEGR